MLQRAEFIKSETKKGKERIIKGIKKIIPQRFTKNKNKEQELEAEDRELKLETEYKEQKLGTERDEIQYSKETTMLTINIICVGKLKEKFFVEAVQEYSKRLSKYCKLNIIERLQLKQRLLRKLYFW